MLTGILLFPTFQGPTESYRGAGSLFLYQWPVCYCWNSPFVGLSLTFSFKGLTNWSRQMVFQIWRKCLKPSLLPSAMWGNVWLQVQIFLGPYSGMPIRSASWINHVTSHALTMDTHLRQKTNVNAGELWRHCWAHFLWGSDVGLAVLDWWDHEYLHLNAGGISSNFYCLSRLATFNSSIEKLGLQHNSIIGLGLASYYTKRNLLSLARFCG